VGKKGAVNTDSDRQETNDRHQNQHDQHSAMHEMMVPFCLAIFELVPRSLVLFHNLGGHARLSRERDFAASFHQRFKGLGITLQRTLLSLTESFSPTKPDCSSAELKSSRNSSAADSQEPTRRILFGNLCHHRVPPTCFPKRMLRIVAFVIGLAMASTAAGEVPIYQDPTMSIAARTEDLLARMFPGSARVPACHFRRLAGKPCSARRRTPQAGRGMLPGASVKSTVFQ
jgi:hypothetical protein